MDCRSIYNRELGSHQIFLKVVDLFHLLKEFLLAIVLALEPLLPVGLAVGDGLAKGNGVDESVLEDSRMGSGARDVVCIVLLAKVPEFVGDI